MSLTDLLCSFISHADFATVRHLRVEASPPPNKGRTKRMQATARRLSVVSATSRARRRLIRNVRQNDQIPMTKTKPIGCGIVLLLLAGVMWYWLSGELFRPHVTTTVDLTAVYPDGRPASNAHFDFTQSGDRVIIPIPFASIGEWREVSEFSRAADSNGHCSFTFFDQICQLDRVMINGQKVKVIGNSEVRGTDRITLNSSLPTWLATSRTYVHQIVVSPPETK